MDDKRSSSVKEIIKLSTELLNKGNPSKDISQKNASNENARTQSKENKGPMDTWIDEVMKQKSEEDTNSQKLGKVTITHGTGKEAEKKPKRKAKREALKKFKVGAELRQTMIIKPRQIEWWERPVVEYAFSHPHVRSRLEKLMGSNIVRLTDREYMQKLQERIYEDHLEMQRRRIKERELEEMERQKKLILEGKVPVEEAPEELMEHPVFKVAEMAKKIIESRNIQQKSATFSVVSTYYYDMEESDEAARREAEEVLGITAGRKKSAETKTDECGLIESTDFMFTPEEYERLKYEMPLVKQLRQLETVDDLYALADDIIGPLKTMKRGQHCGTRGKN